MKRHEVIEVDADINDWGAVSAEYFGELFGVFDDLHGGIRRGVHAKDGILQIDENECSLLVGELKFRHGSSCGASGFRNRGCPRLVLKSTGMQTRMRRGRLWLSFKKVLTLYLGAVLLPRGFLLSRPSKRLTK
jgi:hypothetical protein